MIDEKFIYLGLIIAVIGTLDYVVETLKGNIKPNRITYLFWSLAPLITFLAQLSYGIGIQSLMALSVSLMPLSIFIASFFNKKAYWKLTMFDFICGGLSLLGFILWQVTSVGNIAILFSIIADGLAALPTIRKSYYYPETEKGWPWFTAALYGLITTLTIKKFTFAAAAFPIYYFIAMAIIYVLVQFKLGKKFKLQRNNC